MIMEMWIARDNTTSYEQLFGYYEKPEKIDNCFYGNTCCTFKKDLFPEITFENSPIKVKIAMNK